MKQFLAFVLLIGLVACDNAGEIKAELDSAATKVKNSKTLDSIEAKGERIFDSVKTKGGKLIDKAGDKLDDLRKDSLN